MRQSWSRNESVRAAVVLLVVLVAVFAPVVVLGRTLQAPSWYPWGVTDKGPYGYDGRMPATTFDIDLATPAYYEWPINKLVGQAYRQGELPLWNPYQAAGTPLSEQYSARAFFPYQVLLDISPTWTWDFFFLGRLWIAGFFTYLFLRRLRVSWVSGLFGGILYMLSGTFVWFINLEQLVNVAMVTPVLLWAVETLWHWPWQRGVVAVAIAVALVFLAGQPEVALFVLILGASYAIFRVWDSPRDHWRRRMVQLGIAGTLGLMLATPLLLPFFQFVGRAHHIHPPGGPIGVQDPARAVDAIAIAIPTFYERETYIRFFPDNGRLDWLGGYLGTAPIFFAILGVILVLIQRESLVRKPLLFFALFSTIVILKNFGFPLVFWLGRLPLLDQAWGPRWAGPAWTFPVAVTAALGLEALREQAKGAALNPSLVAWVRRRHWGPLPRLLKAPIGTYVYVIWAVVLLSALATTLALRTQAQSDDILGGVVRNPYFNSAAVPGILVGFTIVGACVLLVVGHLRTRVPVAAFVLLAVAELWFAVPWGYEPLTLKLKLIPLAVGLLGVVAISFSRFRLAAVGIASAVAFFVVIDFTAPSGLPQRYDPATEAPYIQFLKERIGDQRVMGGNGVLMPNFASAVGLQDVRFINALTEEPYHRFRDKYLHTRRLWPYHSSVLWFTGNPLVDVNSAGEHSRLTLDVGPEMETLLPYYSLLGVRYIVTPADYDLHARLRDKQAASQFPLVYDDEVNVYENRGALPRSFVAYQAVAAPSIDEALDMLASPSLDPKDVAILEEPLPGWFETLRGESSPELEPSDTASITNYRLTSVTVEANGKHSGVLVLTDVFAPGWRVSVDGQPAELLRVDGVFRGVYLSEGRHTVVFHYRPGSFAKGLSLAGTALFVMVGLNLATSRSVQRWRGNLWPSNRANARRR